MLTYRLLFVAVLLVNFVIVSRYRHKAQKGEKFSLKEEGSWIAIPLRLTALVGLAYILCYIFAPGLIEVTLVDLPAAARWTGAVLALSLLPISIHWAQRSLGNNVTTTVIIRENHELITHGPYRWIRHPLYVNGLALYGALALVSGSWVIAVLLALGFLIILVRTRKEEAMLIEKFGQRYLDYMKSTGRFIPRLHPVNVQGTKP